MFLQKMISSIFWDWAKPNILSQSIGYHTWYRSSLLHFSSLFILLFLHPVRLWVFHNTFRKDHWSEPLNQVLDQVQRFRRFGLACNHTITVDGVQFGLFFGSRISKRFGEKWWWYFTTKVWATSANESPLCGREHLRISVWCLVLFHQLNIKGMQ